MKEINFLAKYQKATKRDYVQRVVEHDKAESAEIARQWGRDYWDGDRRYGYGGYSYDGRWRPIAEDIVREYGLKAGDKLRVTIDEIDGAYTVLSVQPAQP